MQGRGENITIGLDRQDQFSMHDEIAGGSQLPESQGNSSRDIYSVPTCCLNEISYHGMSTKRAASCRSLSCSFLC